MSSTNGSQNLLTNVFRPVYRYEIPTGGTTAMFTPRLDVCNIDVLSANSISGFTAAIGDENENVYVGSNAGNEYSNLRGCSNVTALGFAAASNISNTKNSVYIGYNAGANALDSSVNVTIGPNTKGNGISNIYIGSNTGSLGTGSNNILIGHNLTGTNLSNTLLIGPTPTIYGNLSTRKVGIGRDPSYNMDISGDSRISYRLGVGMAPGTATDMNNNPIASVTHSLDVSGYTYIRGALGINNDPADYTLNLNGNFKFDDGGGRMILQKDPSGNSSFSYEGYGGKRAVFSIKGDLCADAFIVPGATFSGTVTGGTVVSLGDVSGVSAHIIDINGTRVFGEDVSGYRGRFDRVDATDISGSRGTFTTLNATTLTSANFSTINIVLPGYFRDTLIPTDLDISAGNISNSKTTTSSNFIGSTDSASNRIGGVTLSNSNIVLVSNVGAVRDATLGNLATFDISRGNFRYTGSITGSATGTNSIGGVTLSNSNIVVPANAGIRDAVLGSSATYDISRGNIVYTGAITGSTSTASNTIGGIVLSNSNIVVPANSGIRDAVLGASATYDISRGNIWYSGSISNTSGTASNSIGGVLLSNSNVVVPTNAGAVRDATLGNLATFDISRGNIWYSGSISNTTSTASNTIGGVTLSNTNVVVASNAGAVRDATLGGSATFDISRGNIRYTGSIAGSATASNSIGGIVLSNSNIVVPANSGIRDAILGSSATYDISRGNIWYSGTISNTTGTASNSIGGITLSNSNVVVPNNNGTLRDAATASSATFDISKGNFQGTGTVQAPTLRVLTAGALSTDISKGDISSSGLISSASHRVGAGAVSNPAYAFLADPSAGLYRPAANQLGVAIAGVERMRILSNGYVGIGVTQPDYLLDVSTAVNAQGIRVTASNAQINLQDPRVTFPLQMYANNVDQGIYSANALPLRFWAGNGIRATILGNGNVGIGTTVPNGQLDISGAPANLLIGSTNGTDGLLIQSSTSTVASANLYSYIRNQASGGQLQLGASNVNLMGINQTSAIVYTPSSTGTGLILSNTNAGTVPNGNANSWNESFYFTGNARAWGVGVETTVASSNSLGFFAYTGASGGPISGTRYIKGYIVGGNTANSTAFNFTGQHRCFVKDLGYADLSGVVGLIVSADQNQTINMSGGLKRGKEAITISESLPIVTLTSNAYDKKVFGVIALAEDPEKREDAFGNFVTPLEKQKGDTRAYINSVGEGAIWVVNTGGNIEAGDYVCASAVPGYGQKQNDDLLHNYTVAKISMDCDFTAPLQPKYVPLKDVCGENVLDTKGNLRWTQEIDASGNPVFETAYDIRYVDASGTILDTSANAIVAAFLPCTYHCA